MKRLLARMLGWLLIVGTISAISPGVALAQSVRSASSMNELATLLINAEQTRQAERRQANAALSRTRAELAGRDERIRTLRSELATATSGKRKLESELSSALEGLAEAKLAYTDALARQDAEYARELRILRESGEKLLETEDGAEALRLFNTGAAEDWEQAKRVLDQIERTREEAAQRQRAADRRSTATLYSQKRALGQEGTAATLARWRAVIDTGFGSAADWNNLAELQRDYLQFDAAEQSIRSASELATNDLDRARAQIRLATILLEREDKKAAGPVVQRAIDFARAANDAAPDSLESLFTFLEALNLAGEIRLDGYAAMIGEAQAVAARGLLALPGDPDMAAWAARTRFSAKNLEIAQANEGLNTARAQSRAWPDPAVQEAQKRADTAERSVFALCEDLEGGKPAGNASWLWIDVLADCYIQSSYEWDNMSEMDGVAQFFPERVERGIALLLDATRKDPANRRAIFRLSRSLSRIYDDIASDPHTPPADPAWNARALELLEGLVASTGDPIVKKELADLLEADLVRYEWGAEGEWSGDYHAGMQRVAAMWREIIESQPGNATMILASLKSFNRLAKHHRRKSFVADDDFLKDSRSFLDVVEPFSAGLAGSDSETRLAIKRQIVDLHRHRCFVDDKENGAFFGQKRLRFEAGAGMSACLKGYIRAAHDAFEFGQETLAADDYRLHDLGEDEITARWLSIVADPPPAGQFDRYLLDTLAFATARTAGSRIQLEFVRRASNLLVQLTGRDSELKAMLQAHFNSLNVRSDRLPPPEQLSTALERIRGKVAELRAASRRRVDGGER